MFEDLSTENLFLALLLILPILGWGYRTTFIVKDYDDKEARWLLEKSKYWYEWMKNKDDDVEFAKIKKRTVLASWLGLLFWGIYALLIGVTLIRRIMGM